jgi:hypothetical protein
VPRDGLNVSWKGLTDTSPAIISNIACVARSNKAKLALACFGLFPLLSEPTHSDRLRDWPLDAGATSEANPFEKVPIPANTPKGSFREMSDQVALLMVLVMLSLLCGISG